MSEILDILGSKQRTKIVPGIQKHRVVVTTKQGRVFDGGWQADPTEAMGWEHMLTTTILGERLLDVDIAILSHGGGQSTYIQTSEILAVEIQRAEM